MKIGQSVERRYRCARGAAKSAYSLSPRPGVEIAQSPLVDGLWALSLSDVSG